MSAEMPKIKLPSFRSLLTAGGAAVRRFPEVVVCALVAGTAGAIGIDSSDERFWFRICFAASLGLPLFTGLVLTEERRGWTEAVRWTLRAAGAALLVVWWAASGGWQLEILPVRFFHTAATLHLAVAVLPYLRAKEPWGFWQYNRALFFRFLQAVVYAAAVFVGTALAVAALDNLLGVPVPDETYGRLWFAAAFGLHPLIFLAGVPVNFASLNESREYPQWLKVFSQNVLLPLVAVYVAILMVYMAKILITGTWPSGWISYLVSALAVLGIFSLLMVHPVRMRTEESWIDRYALGFWIAVLPSAAMVLLAVWQRVEQYGITEPRYLLGAMALWLAGTALHRTITRTREIKTIPVTLAAVGALSLVGPWSAYSVAERSQLGRIEEILTSNDVLSGAVLSSEQREISFEEWRQVEDIVRYLVDHHGTGAFAGWSGGVVAGDESWETEVATDRTTVHEQIDGVMARIGVRPASAGRPVELHAASPPESLSTEGYDLVAATDDAGEALLVAGDTLRFALSEDGRAIVLSLGGEEARASLEPLIERAQAPQTVPSDEAARHESDGTGTVEVPASEFVVDGTVQGTAVRLLLGWLRVEDLEDGPVVTEIDVEAALLRQAALQSPDAPSSRDR